MYTIFFDGTHTIESRRALYNRLLVDCYRLSRGFPTQNDAREEAMKQQQTPSFPEQR